MRFEWDEDKRRANVDKHGVDFVDAARMLCGEPLIIEDDRRNYGERRCIAVGEEVGYVLVVIFTIRDGVFRIISARRANARERRKYADL
ncbi:MAG: BrnT family toxin [Solidesulfovibrio sp.]